MRAHSAMRVPSTAARGRISREAAVWSGVLVPPLAWMASQQLSYALVPWVCHGGPHVLLHAVSWAAIAVTLLAALVSWSAWRDSGARYPTDEGHTEGRQRFLGWVGMLAGGVFLAVLAVQEAANLVLGACLA
jgi:hypothetical protein